MGESQGEDETLMAICAEAPGCFEIDPESGEPMGNCVYSKLIQLGYPSKPLGSADGKDGQSINIFTTWSTRKRLRMRPSAKCAPGV